jgi:hypothetical protein
MNPVKAIDIKHSIDTNAIWKIYKDIMRSRISGMSQPAFQALPCQPALMCQPALPCQPTLPTRPYLALLSYPKTSISILDKISVSALDISGQI